MRMRRHDITLALQRAVLQGLAVPATVVCGCGGQASTVESTSDSASAEASDSGSASDSDSASPLASDAAPVLHSEAGAPTCAVSSTTPSSVTNGGSCEETFPLNGSSQSCGVDLQGSVAPSQCATLCPKNTFSGATAMSCFFSQIPSQIPPTTLYCNYTPCGTGRRPEGLEPLAHVRGPSSTARTLAAMAHLEAASVHAFTNLARELETFGAPRALSRSARRAARDEIRHARVVRALAESEGGLVPEVQTAPSQVRAVEDVAIENAVEGCVRETFGAAVARMQAERAGDVQVRRAMRSIARDETRHAELSWAVARWIDRQLDAGERRRVHEARTRAVEALAREVAQEPDPSLTARLGIPSASQARAALGELQASLWSTEVAA
jgi:rubrerythrin